MSSRRSRAISPGAQSGKGARTMSSPTNRPNDIPLMTRSNKPKSDGSYEIQTDPSKYHITHNGVVYQILAVEIEKEAEIGLVLGKIEGDDWVFIDQILEHGMIDTHGLLKENDYLIQVGIYNLVGISVSEALSVIERAYEEGRNTLSFVAARAQEKKAAKDLSNQASNVNKNIVPSSREERVDEKQNEKHDKQLDKRQRKTPVHTSPDPPKKGTRL